jgi:hypothetical protein
MVCVQNAKAAPLDLLKQVFSAVQSIQPGNATMG